MMDGVDDQGWDAVAQALAVKQVLEPVAPTAAMRSFLEWWGACGPYPDTLPAKSRLRIESCPPRFVPFVGLLRVERRAGEFHFQVRLSGERVREQFPFTGPGTWLNEHPRVISHPMGSAKAMSTFLDVVEHRRPAAYQAHWTYRSRLFRYRRLSCPLSENNADVDHLLNFFEF